MTIEFTTLPGDVSDSTLHDAVDRLSAENEIVSVTYKSEPLATGKWYIFYKPVGP